MRIGRGARGAFETVAVEDDAAGDRIELAPGRGGLACALRLAGREVLFLDEASFLDPEANVRGGIPVLFPIAGKIPGDRASVDGRECRLPQHGFARRAAWRLLDAGAITTLELASSPATLEAFPFEFRLRVAYALRGGALEVTSEVANPGGAPLPVHLGFHPYFRVADAAKPRARVEIDATRALDNRTGRVGPLGAIDLAAGEVDLHALDARGPSARLVAGDGSSIRLDFGDFPHVVAWTLPGRDFVCLEPWTAAPGAIAGGAGLLRVAPGGSIRLRFAIALEPG